MTCTAGLNSNSCPRQQEDNYYHPFGLVAPAGSLFLLFNKSKELEQIKNAEFFTLVQEENESAAVTVIYSCRQSVLSVLHKSARCSSNKRPKYIYIKKNH